MKRFVLSATLAATVALMTPAAAQSRGDDSNNYNRGDRDSYERAKGKWDGSSRDVNPGYGYRPYGWGGNPYYGSGSYDRPPMGPGPYGRPPMMGPGPYGRPPMMGPGPYGRPPMGPGPYGAPRPPYGAPPATSAPPTQELR